MNHHEASKWYLLLEFIQELDCKPCISRLSPLFYELISWQNHSKGWSHAMANGTHLLSEPSTDAIHVLLKDSWRTFVTKWSITVISYLGKSVFVSQTGPQTSPLCFFSCIFCISLHPCSKEKPDIRIENNTQSEIKNNTWHIIRPYPLLFICVSTVLC